MDGKVVFITAAGQGIGRATAERFARDGFRVIATDVNREALAALDGAPGIETRLLDVLDSAAVERVIGDVGRVDVLFNCAGVVQHGSVLDAPLTDFDFAFDLNVKAMVRTIKACLPGMLARGDGAIVNMSSVVSSVKSVANRCAYGTTKAAVIGLTKSIAADYVTRGIRCNAICPGTVETPSLEGRLRAHEGDYASTRAMFVARQPIGRFGTPDEVADLVRYLADATYTTGQIHVIDGGWAI